MRSVPPPNALSMGFAEALHERWLVDPGSVPDDWGRWFSELSPAVGSGHQGPIESLARAYREYGHLAARIDPFGRADPPPPELDPAFHGLGAGHVELVERLRRTWCGPIGVQLRHLEDERLSAWIEDRMVREPDRLPAAERVAILRRLTEALVFEEFLSRKFTGAKSFSLEGAESLLPLLDAALDEAAAGGADEAVLAMAHRGRLNVLVHVVGKSPVSVFREFEDPAPEELLGRGDVKYHLGFSAERRTSSGRRIRVSLCFNPSHLEFVDPVVLGRCRAKQDRAGDADRRRKVAIAIHGDAAFAGEGVVAETLNLCQLAAYSIGGTLHVVVDNRIGFTTPPEEGRSGRHATDVARMSAIPIFHVNGDEPEAVVRAVRLAMEFRRVHRRDVVVSLVCYRRRGHNETDEPAFTQPLLYRAIRARPSVRDLYLERLLAEGAIDRQGADRIADESRSRLEAELEAVRGARAVLRPEVRDGVWSGYPGGPEEGVPEVETGIEERRAAALLARLARVPAGFHPHDRIRRGLERRREMARGERPLDWAAGEALAFASLATEGIPVRLTGQDSARGTFSHRHAVLFDVETGRAHRPFQDLAAGQAPVEIENSPLSEAAVLGFEYGYTLDRPDALVAWEAQFGDFVNAAQVVVDQFLAAGEDKWGLLSGLVLLLPHGFEGMGPEHSSARLERFLQLAAEDNLQIVQPTTPAQLFHVLRRQVIRAWRKPLVVFSPKSLLRDPRASSSLQGIAGGRFHRVLPDPGAGDVPGRRVLLTTGRLGYDLADRRRELGRADVDVLRLEQLYPLPERILAEALARYPDGTPAVWVQEEPENMGAWRWLRARFGPRLLGRCPFSVVCRAESASPATGSAASHRLEHDRLLAAAFGGA